MALTILSLYQKVLPKTNCRDCGLATSMAFAGMVISEKWKLKKCPHLSPEVIETYQDELDAQQAKGIGTKKDLAEDALLWAKERAASMNLEDFPPPIGGILKQEGDAQILELPYFTGTVRIRKGGMTKGDNGPLNRWEQVFLYNHRPREGAANQPGAGKDWKSFPIRFPR